jgi:hypothetical protein
MDRRDPFGIVALCALTPVNWERGHFGRTDGFGFGSRL